VTIRVLVVDDERLVRAGFRMILSGQAGMTVVGEAADGLQALVEVERVRPDVVLMDVRMPKLDGLEATRRILEGRPSHGEGPVGDESGRRGRHRPRVIVLTTFDLDEYVYEALRAGASGFLLKDAPEAQLVAAIEVAAAGGSIFAPHATRRVIEAFAVPRHDPPVGLADLTPRELEVLTLIARGRSNREIADALGVSEHTTKTHVAHILDKLGLRDRVQAVVLAYEAGVVHRGDDVDRPPRAADAG
jgi:DNA-binding NarL/FixJ family response regulator